MKFVVLVPRVVVNQDVAVQNRWHFLSHPAFNVHGTCKLSVTRHQTISSSLMRLDFLFDNAEWFHIISKNLGIALYGLVRFPNTWCILCFWRFWCMTLFAVISTPFYTLWACDTVYENTKAAMVHVTSTCDYKTSVFYIDDVFNVLRKLDVYAKGFQTMPVGFKTKLNSGLAFKIFNILKSQNDCCTSLSMT